MTNQPDQPDPTSSHPQESVPSQHSSKPNENDASPADSASQETRSMLDESESGDAFFSNESKPPASDNLDDLFSHDPYEAEAQKSDMDASAIQPPEEPASAGDTVTSESEPTGPAISETLDQQGAIEEPIPEVISHASQVADELSDSLDEPAAASSIDPESAAAMAVATAAVGAAASSQPTEIPPSSSADQPAVNPSPKKVPAPPVGRVLSIDALRGFDMFWIVGAHGLFLAITSVLQNLGTGSLPDWLAPWLNLITIQLEHVDWEGFHFYDLIFPMFVFITGTSTVFSITRRLQTDSKPKILGKILWRTVFLYALGLFYYAGMEQIQNYGDLRYMGVLQRIAIAYGFGAALFLYLPTRYLIAGFAAILIGYYLAVAFIPFEGSSELTYSQRFEEGSDKNLVNYVDSKILKGYKWNGDHDPEGLLSNIPAVGSCLLGIFAGLLLINPEKKKLWKFSMLLLMGLACLGLAFGWGLFFPVIKKLWTSSFVLMAGGWSFLLLAFFYLLIDIWGLKFWAWPFVWIGSNAITIYIMWELIDFTNLAGRIIQFQFADMLGIYAPFAKYLLALFFAISILRFLYKKKVHIRI